MKIIVNSDGLDERKIIGGLSRGVPNHALCSPSRTVTESLQMAEAPRGSSLHSRQESVVRVSGVVSGKAGLCGTRWTQGDIRLCHFLAQPSCDHVFICTVETQLSALPVCCQDKCVFKADHKGMAQHSVFNTDSLLCPLNS